MPRKHFATHNIISENQIGFSSKDYSKFKFGSSSIGKEFGINLFNSFFDKYEEEISRYNRIIVYSSPYDYIPTATMSMSLIFFKLLKNSISSKSEVVFHKISRQTTYTVDYGNLSAKERKKLIDEDTFELVDKIECEDLLIMIDDIKITGSHERVVNKMLDRYKLNNDCFFLYHAILDNDEIPPQFENLLNYTAINSIRDLITISEAEDFIINTRFVKYILNLDRKSIDKFISYSNSKTLTKIIENAFGNKYDKIDVYQKNLSLLMALKINY